MSEALNFEDELTQAVNAKPFLPFVLLTGGGDRYEVTAPQEIIVGQDVVIVVSPKTGVTYLRIYNVVGFEFERGERDA